MVRLYTTEVNGEKRYALIDPRTMDGNGGMTAMDINAADLVKLYYDLATVLAHDHQFDQEADVNDHK